MTDTDRHTQMANAIRFLSMDAVQKANSGHPGLPMGAADIATVLFSQFMKFDPTEPSWPDRDRFVLSAGHGSMLLYSLMYLLGVEDMTLDDIKAFRQMGSKTAGHPEFGHAGGIETTTGPLGQGLANAVGMALAERKLAADFGAELVDHYTYVLASDGDLMEGISHEAISIAGHLKLSKLIVLFDDNEISIDGPTSLSESGDMLERFEAANWDTVRIDGHSAADIATAIERARQSDKPSLIACKTKIGYGAPTKEGTSKSLGAPLGDEEIAGTREALGWPHAPFEVPVDILDAWRIVGVRAVHERTEWTKRLADADVQVRAEFERRMRGDLPAGLEASIGDYIKKLAEDAPKVATRKASEMALEAIVPHLPEAVSGSADLTGSNNTRTSAMTPITADDYSGNFVHWGIREHGMAAAMNGMALHGGLIPMSGTFLVFSDYSRPAIRLAALMEQRVIHVLTHDSIGLGEDGPTHQPVEHLAALRAIPNLNVFRPADVIETAECWQLALEASGRPSVLALTRQGLPCMRADDIGKNRSARGAYELAPAGDEAQVSLFASGSEVEIAMEARKALMDEGIAARVVSVPSFELFGEQDEDYQLTTLGKAPVNIAIEAAIRMGWDRFIGSNGIFIGMSSFGASGPYKEVYEHFGITPQAAVAAAKAALSNDS
ncbi:MAG: transketolase [Devosiaceae bacterium]|nr:transketolase [Devosiaceae bacterium MH13]